MSTPVVPRLARARSVAARGRHAGCGVASQLLNAGTNVVTAYAASLLLVPADFGAFVLAFAAVTTVLALGRGALGSTMLVHLPARDDAERALLVRSALGFALVTGLGASVFLAAGGFAHEVLWWFAPWMAAMLGQDAGRYVLLSQGRAETALGLDVVWAVVQVLSVAGWVLAGGSVTLGVLATAWGLGALSGLVVFLVVTSTRPSRPGRWARATRDVSGWFTAVTVLGQVEVYLVLMLAGLVLGAADVGGVRAVQLLAYQPAVVLLGALLTLLQPGVVRAREDSEALRSVMRRTTVLVTPVIGMVAVIAALADPLTRVFFPQYAAYTALVLPVAVQSAFLALSIGPTALLCGLRAGRRVFGLQLLRAAALAVAAVLGAWAGGPLGVAWALALASGLAWVQLFVASRRSIVQIGVRP